MERPPAIITVDEWILLLPFNLLSYKRGRPEAEDMHSEGAKNENNLLQTRNSSHKDKRDLDKNGR